MKTKRLYRVLSSILPKENQPVPLSPDESHYVTHVLRLPPGSQLEAISGSGQAAMVTLIAGIKKNDPWKIQGISPPQERVSPLFETVPLTLYVSVLKSDAMDWLIEKTVEMGVHSVQPIVSERSLVHEIKERWQKRADQSLKQCERLNRLEIRPLLQWDQALRKLSMDLEARKNHWIASEVRNSSAPFLGDLLHTVKPSEINLWVGPEGGWSPIEFQAYDRLNIPTFSLGPLVLRAETAALTSAAITVDFLRRTR